MCGHRITFTDKWGGTKVAMAEKTLQKVEAELTTCSICLDTYTNPKLLQCFHVYCQGCLARLVFRGQQGQLVLTCPDCRQVTPVPTGRVAGLQSAFHINHLLGIMEEHKKGEDESAHTENSSSCNPTQAKDGLFCPDHADEELKLYCETCEKLICLKCAIKGLGVHHDHNHDLLEKAFEKYKKEIRSTLKPVEKQMVTVREALNELETCHLKITDQQVSIETSIHSSFGHLQDILEVRKTQLINQLHKVTQGKLKNLTAQKDQLETIQAQLGSCRDFMKKSIESDSHRDVLKMKTRVVNQVTELTAPIQSEFLKPCTSADLTYSESADTITDCQNYGRLCGPSIIDASQCYASGEGLEMATVGKDATATLHAVNCEGAPFVQPINSLECELISELASCIRVLGKVERRELSEYEISYQPTIKGRHNLHIKVEGQDIKGSPFCVVIKSSIEHLGTSIGSISGVDGPYGIALTQNWQLIISGFYDDLLHIFRSDGKKLRSLGSLGTGHGQFVDPTGVAVDKNGNIYVADSDNHRVQKFAADGQFLAAVGTRGKKKLQFGSPYGIAVNTNNNKVYVADTDNHRVQVLISDLSFSSLFGSRGSGDGQFSFPGGIACDITRKLVYVTDQGNDRIQVFTEEGKFVRVIGRHGHGEGELNRPSDVAVDSNGMVYVSESGNHRISVFTAAGHFVKCFDGNGIITCPRGLVVDDNGVVYVCDRDSNCVLMF